MTGGAAISAIENIASVANLIGDLIMRASCFAVRTIPRSARSYKPRFARNIPGGIFRKSNARIRRGRGRLLYNRSKMKLHCNRHA
jgi:hypothetical protein